ncbi:MAG: nuclear transport factor 2 family protein [Alphaproteobacteria bacterium]|nr:nuclear transport factor 2 family protein [Alphaproteobacteria bacterium]
MTATEIEALARRVDALEKDLTVLRDKEEIRALKARYCQYVDGGWPEHGGTHMGPVADLFVEDGVWDASPGMPAARGGEAIRRLFVDLRALPFAFHNAVNPVIEVDGDEATGHWHFIGCSQMPDGASAWFLGIYEERYVRTPEGWRYRLMRYVGVRQAARPAGWGDPPGDRPMTEAVAYSEG